MKGIEIFALGALSSEVDVLLAVRFLRDGVRKLNVMDMPQSSSKRSLKMRAFSVN